MSFTDQLPTIAKDLNRQSQGSFQRGRRFERNEVVTELKKIKGLYTELEARELLDAYIIHLDKQE